MSYIDRGAERLLLLWKIDDIIHDWQLSDEESVEAIRTILETNKINLVATINDEDYITNKRFLNQ